MLLKNVSVTQNVFNSAYQKFVFFIMWGFLVFFFVCLFLFFCLICFALPLYLEIEHACKCMWPDRDGNGLGDGRVSRS